MPDLLDAILEGLSPEEAMRFNQGLLASIRKHTPPAEFLLLGALTQAGAVLCFDSVEDRPEEERLDLQAAVISTMLGSARQLCLFLLDRPEYADVVRENADHILTLVQSRPPKRGGTGPGRKTWSWRKT